MSENENDFLEDRPQSSLPASGPGEPLDPGGEALADALRISFRILKLVMIAVVGIFVVSGFFEVEQNEQALILRFGRVQGDGGRAIKTQGLHWKWPSPIDEVVRIPSAKALQILSVDEAFWYYQSKREKMGLEQSFPGPSLQFVRDGYCLTASEGVATWSPEGSGPDEESPMTDYNLIHSQWEIHYAISDAVVFFGQLWSGRAGDWGDVEDFLRNELADAVIVTTANRDINEILYGSGREKYREDVEGLFRARLSVVHTGLEIENLILENIAPPRYVAGAFEAAQSAGSRRTMLITDAEAQRDEIISQARADANIRLEQAKAYSARVETSAESDAAVIETMLDKIEEIARQKAPSETREGELQRQKISEELLTIAVHEKYQEMLREVISKSDETFVLSSKGDHVEWRPTISRSSTLRKKKTPDESP